MWETEGRDEPQENRETIGNETESQELRSHPEGHRARESGRAGEAGR